MNPQNKISGCPPTAKNFARLRSCGLRDTTKTRFWFVTIDNNRTIIIIIYGTFYLCTVRYVFIRRVIAAVILAIRIRE